MARESQISGPLVLFIKSFSAPVAHHIKVTASSRFREAKRDREKRASILEELAGSYHLEENLASQVQIAKAMFGNAAPCDKVSFAMSSIEHPKLFVEWEAEAALGQGQTRAQRA